MWQEDLRCKLALSIFLNICTMSRSKQLKLRRLQRRFGPRCLLGDIADAVVPHYRTSPWVLEVLLPSLGHIRYLWLPPSKTRDLSLTAQHRYLKHPHWYHCFRGYIGMDDDTPSWILVGHQFRHSGSRPVLQVDIQYSNLTTIVVERPEKEDCIADWKTQLFRYFEDRTSPVADAAKRIIDRVLESCRQEYGKGSPLFGNTRYLKDVSGQPRIIEAMDPELEPQLQTAPALFGAELTLPPSVSRSDLQYAVVGDGSFMAQTKPVLFQGETYVAKGPASAESAREDLSEVSNLLSLPTCHPNIVPPPTALITISKEDQRICGYLFPLYKRGNLDNYARKKRKRDPSFDVTVRTWFKQLVSAVKSLIDANTYHGDIKPDNILISDSEELVLIDFTRSSTTMAIASPEVKEGRHYRTPKTYIRA